MSKQQSLTRAIALSLLLAVPCYETVNAAPGKERESKNEKIVINPAGENSTYKTDDGTDATGAGDSGGNARNLIVQATIEDTAINDDIQISGFAGKGGNGADRTGGKGGYGGKGGDAEVYVLDNLSTNGSVTAKNITIEATGGDGGNGGNSDYDGTGGIGGAGGAAAACGTQAAPDSNLTIIADSIRAIATGGIGGNGGKAIATGGIGGNGGAGGAATAYGAQAATDSKLTITATSISAAATGEIGGVGGDGGNGGDGGFGGTAKAYGAQAATGSKLTITADNISATATGGNGGNGGDAIVSEVGGNGGFGGAATAHGAQASPDSNFTITTTASISVTATGGAGGAGGDWGNGGAGGAATAYGAQAAPASKLTITATSISAKATGGIGGAGGYGGNGGDGGNGGTAETYGIYGASNSNLQIEVDSITAIATGGTGGNGGAGVTAGTTGTDGAAAAYGIYAANGSTVTLQSAGNALNIGVTATGGDTKAYAVYADQANIFFGSSTNLNQQANTTPDNTVVTYLADSTFGFVDTATGAKAAGRTVTGGVLQLAGSNTFRFATDLAGGSADKITYDSLAANSTVEKQYITIAYDRGFDGSSLTDINGRVTVLHFDNLNNNDLTKFEAKQSVLDTPLERYIATPTIEVNGKDVNITKIEFEGGGPSESVMAASDGYMALSGIWRAETNNLMKRMGELRSDCEAAKDGVWARYYRGKQSADGAYARSFEQTYTGFQGGIDRMQAYKDGRLVTGLMVNRIDGTTSYHAGNGEMSSTGIGLYASWLGNKGHYLDVIARMSKLNNNFKLIDKSGNFASGDYSTWAYGISTEYGYRQQFRAGWFIEPQAELTFSHVNSAGYTMSNGLQAKHDAVNSAIGRIGFMTGKAFQANGRAGNAYIKASLLHEFGGSNGGQVYYQGKGVNMANGDLGGTWYELGIGANLGLSRNANLYMDALKTFNGDVKTDWQFNAGVRLSF